ncbi:MAG: phosphorylase [Acidobacteriota bacterium]
MSRLGVVAALRREAALLPGRDRPGGVSVAVAGVGPDRAAAAATGLIEGGAAALLSWGLAGGLQPDLTAGDLLIPAEVIDEAGTVYATDAAWRQRLTARLAPGLCVAACRRLLTSRSLLAEAGRKRALGALTGAAAVDMESTAIARVAAAAGRPFLAVRVVCDAAGTAFPAAAVGAVDGAGRTRPVHVLAVLLRRPHDLGAVLRLARAERAARHRLAAVAQAAGPCLEAP